MKITLPIYIHTTKSKTQKSKFILNLNNYRNAHFQKLNASKRAFKEALVELVPKTIKIPPDAKYELTYVYYAPSRRKCDVSNICSIIDKYTCDALTELGFWEDDNIDIIPRVIYQWGGVDKENPRCELFIKNL